MWVYQAVVQCRWFRRCSWHSASLRRRCRRSLSTRSSHCRRRCRLSWQRVECRVCWAGTSCQKDGSWTSHRSVTPCSCSCRAHGDSLGTCSPLCWSFSVLHVSSIPNLGEHNATPSYVSSKNNHGLGRKRDGMCNATVRSLQGKRWTSTVIARPVDERMGYGRWSACAADPSPEIFTAEGDRAMLRLICSTHYFTHKTFNYAMTMLRIIRLNKWVYLN